MKLACNWSFELKKLLDNNLIDIDYVKVGNFRKSENEIDVLKIRKSILLHGLGYNECTGMKHIEVVDFEQVNRLLAFCNSPHLGIHSAIHNVDMDQPMTDIEITKRMLENVEIFKQKIDVPILLENTPNSDTDNTVFDHYPFINPDNLSRIIWDSEVGLLLDLSHTKITAAYYHWNLHDYLKALPLSKTVEMHVNGSGYDQHGGPMDTHSAMKKDDFELLEWVLQYAKPQIITLEHGSQVYSIDKLIDVDSLLDNLKELKKIVV